MLSVLGRGDRRMENRVFFSLDGLGMLPDIWSRALRCLLLCLYHAGCAIRDRHYMTAGTWAILGNFTNESIILDFNVQNILAYG